MSLTPGTKLGPYEILSQLGAGGMGEVYRAKDTRLERTVAVKILPTHLSDNPESKQRFEREARAISSLNHPHICTLHDVGSQDGTSYLVMEYVQGESLDARLQKGPLPLKQALECGVQICDALEKAHRAGIVHRDLKPGNIMLTSAGAKLLDFGLAKPVATLGAPVSSDKGNLTPSTPTMNLSMLTASPVALTQQGTIVGTFQYMAPEMLQGQEADARSDIFSFGCVLYEMLTARRAFEGKSQLSVMTAILEKDPEPLAALQPTSPPALEYAVQTCLEKNPDNRFQTAHDVKLQLAWISKTGSQTGAPAVVAGKGKPSALWIVALAALGAAVIALAAGWWFTRSSALQVVRGTLLPPEGTHFALLNRNGPPVLSPDGRRMVFVASREGRTSLWIRPLDKLDATELPGTDGAYLPFWSPDGHALGFFANGKMLRLDLNGGAPVVICDAPNGRGGAWGSSGEILFTPRAYGNILRVSVEGGTPVSLTPAVKNGLESDRWPRLLPDGKHFLYMHTVSGDADDRNEVHFGSVDGKTDRVLLRGRYSTPQYGAGWLLVGRSGTLVAQKFDPVSGALSGEATQLASGVESDDLVDGSVFAVAGGKALVYQPGRGTGGERQIWVDGAGKVEGQVSEPNIYSQSRLSPDGKKLAVPILKPTADIWVLDLAQGTRSRLSFGGKNVDNATWSADGRTIYFSYSPDNGPMKIYQRPADGSRPQQAVIATQTDAVTIDVSSDGKWLLYEEGSYDAPGNASLKALALAGGAKPFLVLDRVDWQSNARLMPGSNAWLAYQSSESGNPEVYLTHFPSGGAKYQVSVEGGTQPVWSPDDKRLYYLDARQRLTVVDVQAGKDSVNVGATKVLFQTGVRASALGGGYDVARNGRFLMNSSVTESPAPLTFVLNWDAELKK
jgi:eukaryotic-like serine/threonine-protein kinase